MSNLNEYIQVNTNFKTAINLYLSLNKKDKVLSYIPTKASASFLEDYLSAVLNNKEQATLLVGPYGKGKSHLLLVMLAVLSMERNKENTNVIKKLETRFKAIDAKGRAVAEQIKMIWNGKRFLPVVINDTTGDLNQSFISALNDALKREGLDNLSPDTYYSIAVDRINTWEESYPETYKQFCRELKKNSYDAKNFVAELNRFSTEALRLFIKIHPSITSGSEFNPMASSEVLPLYKSVCDRLVEEYDFGGIYIVFDEFSKFIEGQNKKNVGNNMKLLQDMCELANESGDSKLYFTMVTHKSIKEYGKYLSSDLINAFTGIEGRIIEKYFVTSSKNNYELIKHAIIKDVEKLNGNKNIAPLINDNQLERYYKLPVFSSNFEKSDFDNLVLKGCYPLNPVATYLLLNVSEKVAQNERTLFTFISNDEPNSMARYVQDHDKSQPWVLGADSIYDYFSSLFKKDISNELVHNIWLGAEAAIKKCETENEVRIIKAMAIIQIVNKEDEIRSNDDNIVLALSDESVRDSIDSLENRKVIYKKGASGAYAFKSKAGVELRTEIKKQKELKGDNVNYGISLQSLTGDYYVLPREYNTKHLMTRYFQHEYMNVEDFLALNTASVLFDGNRGDGKVVTLYSFKEFDKKAIEKHFASLKSQKLVVVIPSKILHCKKQLAEYEILQGIKQNREFLNTNEAIVREIPILEDDITTIVESEMREAYVGKRTKILYLNSEKVCYATSKEGAASSCCKNVYIKSPEINNEIINRSSISTAQTKKSRLVIMDELLRNGGSVKEDFYAGTNQEATIFRSLFCNTGIINGEPKNNISEVIGLINTYIDSCVDNRKPAENLITQLTAEPFGMRLGVIPVYFAYVLSKRREDIVVYYVDTEVQLDSEILVKICERPDEYSLFVSKEDHFKEKYISKLNELFLVSEARNLTDNRIKNIVICMQRWFRSLPLVSRNIICMDGIVDDKTVNNMKILQKILQQVEYNPYEILFVTLPGRYNSKTFDATYKSIAVCKKEFDEFFDNVNERIIEDIYSSFGGKRKLDLYHTLKEWYERQSNASKQGLLDGRVTAFMSCIEKLNVHDDREVARLVAKAVTDVFVDNWTDATYEDFLDTLSALKTEIENVKDDSSNEQHCLTFTGVKGNKIEKYYENANEGTGSILRNILEDTLDEFDDLSVNDRVAILLEMIEKVIG